MVNVIDVNPDRPELRPVDLPEMRADTATILSDPRIDDVWQRLAKSAFPSNSADAYRKVFMSGLRQADLFWVAAPMAELVDTGARTVPAFTLQREDVPSRSGLIFFETPVTGVTAGEGTPDEVRQRMDGALWVDVTSPDGVGAVAIYSLAISRTRHLMPLDCFTLGYGQPMPDRKFGQLDFFRAIRAAWLLMRQQLAEAEDVEPDRASRKRQRRAGYEPRAIRVINLRRPQGEGSVDGGQGNYHHQWIVRGHWRNHWHPKRQVHRPVWIAPHVKGPEGAPMIGGEKVYAWKK